MTVVDWLLEGDPAIRWQVLRDLTHASPEVVAAERTRVEHEGWGAQLLTVEDADGLWDGGACFPGGYTGGEPGQPWTATMHVLQTLVLLGLDPASESARRMVPLIAENGRWEHDGQRYFDGEVEPCINGRTIEAGAYFGVDVAPVVDRVLGERLADGGWNCEAENGSVRSSFHTTIDVLDGLLEFERRTGGSAAVSEARRGGEEYLLERELFKRKSTGEVADPRFLDFAFPYYWRYDVLRALDYFRGTGADPDPRMAEAVDLVRSKRQPDGRWLLDRIHPGRVHFDLEDDVGTPSRWNTLRALRVLDWWDGAAPVRRGRAPSRSPAADHTRSHPSRSGCSRSQASSERSSMASKNALGPAARSAVSPSLGRRGRFVVKNTIGTSATWRPERAGPAKCLPHHVRGEHPAAMARCSRRERRRTTASFGAIEGDEVDRDARSSGCAGRS